MIRISENGLTLDQNSSKTKLRAFKIQFLAQTKHAKYWLQLTAEPETCCNSFAFICIKWLGEVFKLLLRY